MARRVKGGQKLVGVRKKVPLATRRKNAQRAVNAGRKGLRIRDAAKGGPLIRRAGTPLARGVGKFIGNTANRLRGIKK